MMIIRRNILVIVFITALSNSFYGQVSSVHSMDNAILGSFHFASYASDNAFTSPDFVPGVALEYRRKIDSLSAKFYLTLGVSLESVPLKTVGEDGHYTNTQFNFTLPLGLYYRMGNAFHLGLYSSVDIPFAAKHRSSFGGDEYSNTEFDFRYLNINLSAGLNIGKVFTLNDHQIIIELHFKALGVLGLKSNDYWHYPEDGFPYYTGLRVGYGF